MFDLYAVQLHKPTWSPLEPVWLRVYKNQKQWVVRKHIDTATKFASLREAQGIIQKFELQRHDARIFKNGQAVQ